MNFINKNEIKYIENEFTDFNVEHFLLKIEKTASKSDMLARFGTAEFLATGGYWAMPLWEIEKLEIMPDMWRAIYKYSNAYGEYNHSNADFSILDPYVDKNIKILDFGPGPNPLGVGSGDSSYGHPNFINRCKCEFHLVEINDRSREKIKQKFDSYSNVFVYENLSEVFDKNIKFNVIFSSDVLEHVRYINEHLLLLYFLCKEGGCFYLDWEYGQVDGGHVSGLYDDTIIDPILWKAFNVKDCLTQKTSKYKIKQLDK